MAKQFVKPKTRTRRIAGLPWSPDGVAGLVRRGALAPKVYQNCAIPPNPSPLVRCSECGLGASKTQLLGGVCEDCREDAAYEAAIELMEAGIELGYSRPDPQVEREAYGLPNRRRIRQLSAVTYRDGHQSVA